MYPRLLKAKLLVTLRRYSLENRLISQLWPKVSTKKDPGFFFRAARVFLQGAEEKEVHLGFEMWKCLNKI